jgi:hypothetical protein
MIDGISSEQKKVEGRRADDKLERLAGGRRAYFRPSASMYRAFQGRTGLL